MPKFEIDVKMIVEADSEEEAGNMATSAVDNMVCGSITEAWIDGVTDLSMADFEMTSLDEIGDGLSDAEADDLLLSERDDY